MTISLHIVVFILFPVAESKRAYVVWGLSPDIKSITAMIKLSIVTFSLAIHEEKSIWGILNCNSFIHSTFL